MFTILSLIFLIASFAAIYNSHDIFQFGMLAGISAAFAIASSISMVANAIDRLLHGSIKYENKNYIDGTSEIKFDKKDVN